MDTTVTDHFRIQAVDLRRLGAVNGYLVEDSPYFIDPRLLERAKTPELQGAGDEVYAHFGEILALMRQARKNDSLWRAARQRLRFKEPRGLRLGYAESDGDGRGIGVKLGDSMLLTVQEFVKAGIADPAVLSLLVVVEKDIGPDRMSDLVARLIYGRLGRFSERVFRELGIPGKPFDFPREETYVLPENPFNGDPVVLVPAEILRNLPTGEHRSDWEHLYGGNEELREFFNRKIQEAVKKRKLAAGEAPSKAQLLSWLLANPKVAKKAVGNYRAQDVHAHDFVGDPRGLHLLDKAKELAQKERLPIMLPAAPTPLELHGAALHICNWFKSQVENNAASELLRYPDGRVRDEKTVQNLFNAVAGAHAQYLDIDLSKEPNAGRGPVDFKFSKGASCVSLVEVKLASNPRLVHGYERQLAEYQKAERTLFSVLLVVDYNGKGPSDALKAAQAVALRAGHRAPDIVYVDARRKASASKYQPEHTTPSEALPT